MRNITIHLVSGTFILASFVSQAVASEHKDEVISHAKSAAPSFISDDATVMTSDGTVLVEGSNGWTCLPDTMPDDNAPMCNDAVWMKLRGLGLMK